MSTDYEPIQWLSAVRNLNQGRTSIFSIILWGKGETGKTKVAIWECQSSPWLVKRSIKRSQKCHVSRPREFVLRSLSASYHSSNPNAYYHPREHTLFGSALAHTGRLAHIGAVVVFRVRDGPCPWPHFSPSFRLHSNVKRKSPPGLLLMNKDQIQGPSVAL